MKIEVGTYRGREISELASEYLKRALGHLTLSDAAARGIQAEYTRRRNAPHQSAQTPTRVALSSAVGL